MEFERGFKKGAPSRDRNPRKSCHDVISLDIWHYSRPECCIRVRVSVRVRVRVRVSVRVRVRVRVRVSVRVSARVRVRVRVRVSVRVSARVRVGVSVSVWISVRVRVRPLRSGLSISNNVRGSASTARAKHSAIRANLSTVIRGARTSGIVTHCQF